MNYNEDGLNWAWCVESLSLKFKHLVELQSELPWRIATGFFDREHFHFQRNSAKMSFFHFRHIILCLVVLFSAANSIAKDLREQFTEALLLRPLPDRKVLAHFHFQSTAAPTQTYGRHHHLFPKSIYHLASKQSHHVFGFIFRWIHLSTGCN